MSLALRILFAAAMLPLAIVPAARAEDAATYVVSYVEVLPAASDQALAVLKLAAVASRTEDGNVRFDVLRQIALPHHFAILEVWKDAKAQETHAASAQTKTWREKLMPLLASPYDERVHVVLAVGAAKPAGPGAVYAVTHVDCIGPRKDDGMAQLKEVSTPSREEAGSLRFDALQQASRANHFTIIALWRDDKAVAEHVAAAHTRQFRTALQPMIGSPYDERLYKAVN
jgi:quinol monooxygenase YgiN